MRRDRGWLVVKMEEEVEDSRSSRIAGYSRNLGDAFKGSGVLAWFDELLAERLHSCLGCEGHSVVKCEADETFKLI